MEEKTRIEKKDEETCKKIARNLFNKMNFDPMHVPYQLANMPNSHHLVPIGLQLATLCAYMIGNKHRYAVKKRIVNHLMKIIEKMEVRDALFYSFWYVVGHASFPYGGGQTFEDFPHEFKKLGRELSGNSMFPESEMIWNNILERIIDSLYAVRHYFPHSESKLDDPKSRHEDLWLARLVDIDLMLILCYELERSLKSYGEAKEHLIILRDVKRIGRVIENYREIYLRQYFTRAA